MTRALVTGANRGIGLEFCRQLQARGVDVIGVCRNASPALNALGIRVESGVDVTNIDSLADLKSHLDDLPIDLLINNAGILLREESLERLDLENIRQQFEVNALGPLCVTRALLPNLTAKAKIALVTSRMGSIADNSSGGYYGYRMSKVALNMAGVSLAQDLLHRDIAVIILHPGYVRTEMTGNQGYIDPPEAVSGMLARIDELTLANTGQFYHSNGEILPW
jgi:NAD(P)-dependent dehydrogenase (short-subunit alcohol dehydrogenase family)